MQENLAKLAFQGFSILEYMGHLDHSIFIIITGSYIVHTTSAETKLQAGS